MRYLNCAAMMLLTVLPAACAPSVEPDSVANTQGPPNFLIIMTDDMGFTDLGAFGGHDIQTPNLDALALNGIRFTNFHGHLSCAPSRALLMSGTGNHEAGLGTQVDIESFRGRHGYERFLTDRVVTLPEILRAGGYRTYIAGKWGLGGPQGVDPTERGFEKSMVLLPSGGGHYQPIFHDVRYSRNGEVIAEQEEPTYSTTLFTDALIEFFEADKENDKPFFALFTPTAPHWPLHFPPDMQDAFVGAYADGYDVVREQRVKAAEVAGVLPVGADVDAYESEAADWQSLSEDEQTLNSRIMEIYAAMTTHLDSEIGRLLNALRNVDELENTLILFINDNGAQGGPLFGGPRSYSAGREFDNHLDNLGAGNSWANMGQGWADAVNAPFRDGKGSVYEGGLRVAAFANWAGQIRVNSINRQYLNNMDVMPTLLELAGLSHPAPEFDGRQVLPMRGRSFAGLLRGEEGRVHPPDESIALSSAGRHFIYRGNWKLLKELNGDWELYNLATDPYERINLAADEPKLLQELLVDFERQAEISNILDR